MISLSETQRELQTLFEREDNFQEIEMKNGLAQIASARECLQIVFRAIYPSIRHKSTNTHT